METAVRPVSLPEMPVPTKEVLEGLVASACHCLGEDLRSVVLYGSAAEGRLRATSDVNLLFVLARFDAARVDPLREPLRAAAASIQANAMFVLETELGDAAEEFAVKFDDIRRRHVVLHGADLLSELKVSREALARRLRQTLLNLAIRLRERYALVSLREEQIPRVVADAAGPLRVAASAMLEIEGRQTGSPKQALELLAKSLDGGRWDATLAQVSAARETGELPPGTAAGVLLDIIALAARLREVADAQV